MQKGRLEAFSDGVIAILITIMVLELEIPHEADAVLHRVDGREQLRRPAHRRLRRGAPAGSVAYFVLQRAIVAEQGPDSTLAAALGRDMKGKVSPAIYAGHPPGVRQPVGGGGPYVVVAVMRLVPDRRLESKAAPT